MNLRGLNLNLLVALESLLTERNVTKAGERIFVTQSAMSIALRQLREIFEDELLVRSGNNLILTPRAEELLPKLRKLLNEAENLVKRQEFDPQTAKKTFRLGLTEYSALVILPTLYQYFKKYAPGIQLDIKHIVLHGEKEALEKDEVDLAIGLMSGDSSLKKELLFTDTLVCAAKESHPLMLNPLTIEKYLEASHLCFTVKDNTCPYVTDIILSHMGTVRNVTLRVPHVVPALYVILNSDLLITLPRGIVFEAKKMLPLASQELPFHSPPLSFMQVWQEKNEEDAAHSWLRFSIQKISAVIQRSYFSTD